VAVDATGDLFIADNGAPTSGISPAIYELPVGGALAPLTFLDLSLPTGVAVDGADNVYFADFQNLAVYKLSADGHTLTTLADASSGLNEPYEVAVDGPGNVFIDDAGMATIYELPVGTTTLIPLFDEEAAGGGLGLTVDARGNVYFATLEGGVVYEIPASTLAVPANLPLTNLTANVLVGAGLAAPVALAVDGAGNLYITETGNFTGTGGCTIQEWPAGGNTLIPLVTNGLVNAFGLAVDGSGNLFIADGGLLGYVAGAGTLLELPAGAKVLVPLATATNSPLRAPSGVAVDGYGNVFITDIGNLSANPSGNQTNALNGSQAVYELPRVFVDPSPRVENPVAGSDSLPMVLPPVLNLSLSGPFAPGVADTWLTLNGTTGGVVDFSFTANGNGANRETQIVMLGQTIPITQHGQQTLNLFVSDAGSGCIYAIAPDGTRTTFASGLGSPAGLVFDSRGDLFAPDLFSGNIYEFVSSGGGLNATPTLFGSVPAQRGVGGPEGVALDPAGNLYVADTADSHVYQFTPAGVRSTLPLSFNVPFGLAFDTAGNLFVSEVGPNDVLEIPPGQTTASVYASGLAAPYGLTFNRAGVLFEADYDSGDINEFSNGSATPYATGLDGPSDLVFDSAGDLFEADYLSGQIHEFTFIGEVTFAAGRMAPAFIAFQPSELLRCHPPVGGAGGGRRQRRAGGVLEWHAGARPVDGHQQCRVAAPEPGLSKRKRWHECAVHLRGQPGRHAHRHPHHRGPAAHRHPGRFHLCRGRDPHQPANRRVGQPGGRGGGQRG
jgi:sugar lactone lactonase YvrE